MPAYHPQQNLNLHLRGMGNSPTVAINERCNELIKQNPHKSIIKLGLGQSPFPVPDPVQRALRENVHQKDYLPVRGLFELREAIATFHNGQFKHKDRFAAKDVLIGPGSKELMFLLQFSFCAELLVPCPSWVSYDPQARVLGRTVQYLPTDHNFELQPETLKQMLDQDPSKPRLLILNYPCNPTGGTFSDESLRLLADAVRGTNTIVLSDEIYMLTHHEHGTFRSIASYLPEQTIISSGVSKGFGMGGYRLGYFIFPQSLQWLMDAMSAMASETFTSVSAPIQHACIRAFVQDNERDKREMDDYLKKSSLILNWLGATCHAKLVAAGAVGPAPDGAFYLFLDLAKSKMCQRRKFTSSIEMCEAILDEIGVAMLPGASFGCEIEDLYVRIAYVDFDGRQALEKLVHEEGISMDKESFLKECCGKTMTGIEKLASWLQDRL